MAEVLMAWRIEVAATMGMPINDLASDRALFAIISDPPGTHFELHSVAGLYQPGLGTFGRGLVDRVRRNASATID